MTAERQITSAPHGHILTNCNVWSADGRSIVYDVRSDPAGEKFDGDRIEIVDVASGAVRTVYQSQNGAHCGVATFSPTADTVAFILGPERPTPDWTYGPARRRGALVDLARPGIARPLDARNLVAPLTPGALRGGSHVHIFSGDGGWISFTYEDHLLDALAGRDSAERNRRSIAVSVPRPVTVPKSHPRNHDGEFFSVIVADTTDQPIRGSDQIGRAFEESWIGSRGYRRADGSWQNRALAFQGNVVTDSNQVVAELFVVDLPDDLTVAGTGPLEGSATTYPRPPRGIVQRRLTFTTHRKFPGVQGPRHWLRSSPDGSSIAFLMRDDDGIAQLWTISPNGGPPRQLTHNAHGIASTFTWNRDGSRIAHVMDRSICSTNGRTGETRRLTPPSDPTPRPEACVFSPDGSRIAFVRTVPSPSVPWNQIFICEA